MYDLFNVTQLVVGVPGVQVRFFLFILAHAEVQQGEEHPEMEMALSPGIPPRSIWKAWVARDELGKQEALKHLSNARKADTWLPHSSEHCLYMIS